MPEYLAPGVYVEETSFRSKSIEGVSTTTTGFVGPTRYGPIDLEPDIITSLGEFERVYGDRQQLKFTEVDENGNKADLEPMHNYMWHAVRAFFEQEGKRLYISRVFRPIDGKNNDGCAEAWIPKKPTSDADRVDKIRIRARFPGKLGEMRVRLTLKMGQNILKSASNILLDGDVVWINDWTCSPPLYSPPVEEYGGFYLAKSYVDENDHKKEIKWKFENLYDGRFSPPQTVELSSLTADPNPKCSDKLCVVTVNVFILPGNGNDIQPIVYEGIPLHPGHKRAGEADSLFDRFAARPGSFSLERRLPIVIEIGKNKDGNSSIADGIDVLKVLCADPKLLKALNDDKSNDAERSIDLVLEGGNDGQRPKAGEYEGTVDHRDRKTGLKAFEDIEDISIVAAPGSTFRYENGYRSDGATIISNLISHAERMKYRIAVLDSGEEQTIADVRAMRAGYDSKYAALYYPWVRVLDPVTRAEIHLPPSGFVAGIYARNDRYRAVYKAPANEVVNLAIGFETMLNKSQQEVLNPEGINCFRFFEGRGYRLWGARTISSDSEWKYVNLRRYFAFLERSIDKGTQWAVFEPNGEALWVNIRRTVEDFLFNEYQMGALLGEKPEKAFFVKCDRSTMTQNDLDNGRLVCLIGVAALRPAEFVIFRIGQWTADRKG
jgi:phage tail sheath protein FI